MDGKTIKVGDIVKITDRDCLISDEPVMSCHQKCGCRDANCATIISKIYNHNGYYNFGIKFKNGESCARNEYELVPYESGDEFHGLCPRCDSADVESTTDLIYNEKTIRAKAAFTCNDCDYDFEVEFKDGRVLDNEED